MIHDSTEISMGVQRKEASLDPPVLLLKLKPSKQQHHQAAG